VSLPTSIHDVVSITVHSAQSTGALVVNTGSVSLPIYDLREGEEGCKLVIETTVATRADVLAWLAKSQDPKVEVIRNPMRYNHVSYARFFSEASV